jgi:hypothetical protein
MRKPLDTPAHSLGTIRRDEVLPFAEVCRRMGWADQMAADVQRMGLPAVVIGRRKYTTGAAVYDFVQDRIQQAQRQVGEGDRHGGDGD